MKGESADKTRVALLPGLDGTGENFAPIIPHLEQACSVQVIRYTNEQTFNDYVRSAERQLSGNNPVSLVAESFSGPIAISLIRRQPWQYLPS